jgi:hypothetical protein
MDEDDNQVEVFMTSDELTERQFSIAGKKGQFIDHDGRRLKRVYVPCGTPAASVWPIHSAAAGCDVSQIKEQTEYDRSVGIPTDYSPKTGDAIYRDASHRRKHLKHHGLVDRDSFI